MRKKSLLYRGSHPRGGGKNAQMDSCSNNLGAHWGISGRGAWRDAWSRDRRFGARKPNHSAFVAARLTGTIPVPEPHPHVLADGAAILSRIRNTPAAAAKWAGIGGKDYSVTRPSHWTYRLITPHLTSDEISEGQRASGQGARSRKLTNRAESVPSVNYLNDQGPRRHFGWDRSLAQRHTQDRSSKPLAGGPWERWIRLRSAGS
jgi:hypothetical protein